ncbi:T9SS type B sorting domain-containing protein [Hymenobacter aquaticus]|uniref:T9SS type B sorting domain-containing protein n=1 Tax=Hymenobacter aquaticus TaxID=1867101 RepID=A0A4Z0PZ89_9BACT|nr:gliding motility-associated C-terminal domain-containing protein [Hymenobacter aquaticus]TGE21782.1 T9SS type B sorting domain-containing protein [Hymenobacter aquaticus]
MWRKLLCLAFLGTCCLSSGQAQTHGEEAPTLEFVENRGQWPAVVRYGAELPDGRLFLEPGGLTYSLRANVPHDHSPKRGASPKYIQAHGLRVAFVGGAPQPALEVESPTTEVRNYLLGNDPSKWAHNVRGFRQLQYSDIWSGIGARFYENQQQQLEYDFAVAAGADPAAIGLRYEGAESVTLTSDGSLEVRTSVGVLRELAPTAWQTDAAGHRRAVACAYVLEGQTVRFKLGAYNPSHALTIDPTVVFSSFTGSMANNLGFTATYDQQGNLYSASIAFSSGYPVTTGAYRTTFAGSADIAIIKFNTATTGPASRVWATYLGGTDIEYPNSLVVGSQGDLFVMGTTSSRDYPVSAAAYDRTFGGGPFVNPGLVSMSNGSDLVISRLSANGSTLVASTFLGGTGNDGVMDKNLSPLVQNWGDNFRGDILLDANDNIYLATNTASTDFPTTNGLGGAYRGGTYDGVVCKLNSTATSLLWSSFVGGSGLDAAYSLQFDAAGGLYVTGGTTSPNFPTTPGSLNPTARGGTDGFLLHLNSSGNQIQQSTYLGTAGYDQGYFVQLDGSGAVYVLGQSLGSYPVTAGRYQNAGSRQFIHKLNATLSATDFSTVFGSGRASIDISPTAFLVDQCNRIYATGWGGGINSDYPYSNGSVAGLPVTSNAVQRTTDGADFYLLQLAPDATRLDYATYMGQNGGLGDHVDGGTSRFDPRGVVYQAVCLCQAGFANPGFPVPPGAGSYSPTSGSPSGCNNAAVKFNFESVTVTAGTDGVVCVAAGPQPLTGSPAGGTWTGPGVSGSVAAGYFFTPSAALLGVQTLTYTVTGVGPCGGVSTLRLTVVASPPAAAFTGLSQTAFCQNNFTPMPSVTLSAQPAGGTFSGPGVSGNTFNPNSLASGSYVVTYNVTTGGCTLQATQTMQVIRTTAGNSFSTCSTALPVALTGGLPAGGTWSGPGVSGSVAAGFVFTPSAALVGSRVLTYSVMAANGSCASTATLTATVQQGTIFTPPALGTYCSTSSTPVALSSQATWSGSGVRYTSGGYTFTPSLAGVGTFALRYQTGSGYGACDANGLLPVTVMAPAVISMPTDTIICPGSTAAFRLRALPAGGTWSGPNVSSSGIFTPPAGLTGSVTLTYTVSGVCSSSGTRRITVATPPLYAAVWKADQCAETRQAPFTVTFSDPLNSFAGVRWDFGDGTQGSGNSTKHVYSQPGRYTPRIIRPYNNGLCTVQLELPVVEVTPGFQIPNIFTPNKDGVHDVFLATNGCPAHLQVFSRWGNKVYESVSYRNDWDGGQVPDGTYYYHLQQVDGVIIKGWIEISR